MYLSVVYCWLGGMKGISSTHAQRNKVCNYSCKPWLKMLVSWLAGLLPFLAPLLHS